MTEKIKSIRGMHDMLPENSASWQLLEYHLLRLMDVYGYQEIRMPIVESTDLFSRSIGDVTDIVQKEMYTFEDRNGDSLTLRPEGTASCVRAGIEHDLLRNQQIQRLWYMGPMFRHEKPQKGRYRQFSQLGVEVFGLAGPDIDAELMIMTARLWRELGIADLVTLQLNSIGTAEDRDRYRQVLIAYLQQHEADLDDESRDRLKRSPMRVLDSKNPDVQAIIQQAPLLSEYLSESSAQHFADLCTLLDKQNIRYQLNPHLVRGLDYYNHTVFEWVTEQLGAQGTLCAGGRYDGLVEQLAGSATPAIGFAIGLDRLLVLLEQQAHWQISQSVDVYVMGSAETAQTMRLAEKLRDSLPELSVLLHCGAGSMKTQMKKADKSGAEVALILGEQELTQSRITIKCLRQEQAQQSLTFEELIVYLADYFNSESFAALHSDEY